MKKDYVLLERNVSTKVHLRKGEDILERAIDKTVEKSNGEYLMNAKIYIKANGRRMKVVGDVYGDKSFKTNIETTISVNNNIQPGDLVSFKVFGVIYEGKLVGVNQKKCIVEYQDKFGKTIKKELDFSEITKLTK